MVLFRLCHTYRFFDGKAGAVLKVKGRPPKDYEITEDMKINELKYIIARKDSKIKQLEMENELMRDFLSLTERKLSYRLNIKSSLSTRTSIALIQCVNSLRCQGVDIMHS